MIHPFCAKEARRQQQLMVSLQSAPSRNDAPGLRAYRVNAYASAERALGAACPTVRALLGTQDFAQMAREFWHAHPPQRGDLGEWGHALPSWIAAHTGLRDWPYLDDCARLDLAIHNCERAADAKVDVASFGLLSSADPASVQLLLMPGAQALISRWPLASVYAAHQAMDDCLFKAAREALNAECGQAVVVARCGWRAHVQLIDKSLAVFTQSLADQRSLGQALESAPEGFDFGEWFATALRHNWVKEARPARDISDNSNDRGIP